MYMTLRQGIEEEEDRITTADPGIFDRKDGGLGCCAFNLGLADRQRRFTGMYNPGKKGQ